MPLCDGVRIRSVEELEALVAQLEEQLKRVRPLAELSPSLDAPNVLSGS